MQLRQLISIDGNELLLQFAASRAQAKNRAFKLLKFAVLPVILLITVLSCQIQNNTGADSILLDNARIIVGDGSVIEVGSILIQNTLITAVGNKNDMALPVKLTVLDMSGKTVMPAMIDAHAHLGYEAATSWGSENYGRENLIDNLQRYAYYGFSAVFSAGSDPDELAFSVQQAQTDNEFVAARFLFAAGMAPPGQGPNNQFLTHALAVEEQTGTKILYGVGTEAQARDAVTEIASKGISVIKIWVDDRGGSQEKLSPELYRIIINQAKSHSIQVFVHQQYATDIPDLLDAGVSGFLHGRLGSDLTDSIAQQLASSGAFVVPNLGLGELRREAVGDDLFLQETIPASVARRLSVAAGQRQAATAINAERERQRERELSESFTRLIAADVNVILGTDAGAVPDHFFGYTGHRELEIFVRLGMTPMQALIAATSKPATSLGLQDLGFLKEGFSADLLVLDSNPLDNIRNTRSISRVYLSGKEIDRESMRSRFTN